MDKKVTHRQINMDQKNWKQRVSMWKMIRASHEESWSIDEGSVSKWRWFVKYLGSKTRRIFIYYKIFISPKILHKQLNSLNQFTYKIGLLWKIICETLEIYNIYVKGHKWVQFFYLIWTFQTWEQLKSSLIAKIIDSKYESHLCMNSLFFKLEHQKQQLLKQTVLF